MIQQIKNAPKNLLHTKLVRCRSHGNGLRNSCGVDAEWAHQPIIQHIVRSCQMMIATSLWMGKLNYPQIKSNKDTAERNLPNEENRKYKERNRQIDRNREAYRPIEGTLHDGGMWANEATKEGDIRGGKVESGKREPWKTEGEEQAEEENQRKMETRRIHCRSRGETSPYTKK